MLEVTANFTTKYRFSDKAEKKIKNYAKKKTRDDLCRCHL